MDRKRSNVPRDKCEVHRAIIVILALKAVVGCLICVLCLYETQSKLGIFAISIITRNWMVLRIYGFRAYLKLRCVININLQDSKKEAEKPRYMTTIANLLWVWNRIIGLFLVCLLIRSLR